MTIPVAAAARAEYAEHGFVIFRGLLDRSLAAELLERVDGMLAGRYPSAGFVCGAASDQRADDPGRLIQQVMPREFPIPDAVLAAYADNDILSSIARELMGSATATVFQQQTLIKQPGGANATPWHQDEFYWRFRARHVDAITAWMPLLPATAANGTMWLLPGSHRRGILPHAPAGGISKFMAISEPIEEGELVPLELEPGDVSFHHRDLVHGAYANTGTRRRAAIAQHYRSG